MHNQNLGHSQHQHHHQGHGSSNGMYPPQARDYHHMPQDPGPSTYHQTHTQAYNPYPLPGAAFNQNPVMSHHMDQLAPNPQHEQSQPPMPQYSAARLTQPVPTIIGPSPDSNITTPTPRSGQNNLDLSGYLDPTDKVEPKLPFFHNNPSIVRSAAEEDPAAAGRMSDGEDPGEQKGPRGLRLVY
jgi:hypothetical protein